MGKKVGIDLGTTNSVVAILNGDTAKVLHNSDAKPQTRSVVSPPKKKGKLVESPDEFLVGDPALDNWPMAPRDTIISVKRLMGRRIDDDEIQRIGERYLYQVREPSDGTRDGVRVLIAGREYSPIDVSAMILKKLKQDAEMRLGDEVTHAVITVPAYFTQIQREATWRAAQQAGLKVLNLLDEPTAAAIAFGMDAAGDEAKTVVVYDLGGGTFDISVLMIGGGTFAPLALKGDMWLGGDDFDQKLVEHALAHIDAEYGLEPKKVRDNLRFMVELRKSARAVKERLTSSRSATLIVTGLLRSDDDDLIDVELEVTQTEYAPMIAPLIAKTIALTLAAIAEAGQTPDQIDCVLLAGNSTCVPAVREAVQKVFGKDRVLLRDNPKELVAQGAAIMAARSGDWIVCPHPDPKNRTQQCGHVNEGAVTTCAHCTGPLTVDDPRTPDQPIPPGVSVVRIAPFHYGVETVGDKFNLFVRKNDPYPTAEDARTAQSFPTRFANQRIISIPVYGGEHLDRATANEKQGEALAILPKNLPKETTVRIKLWLEQSGRFQLTAHLKDGTDLQPWMTTGEIDARAVQAIVQANQLLLDNASKLPPEEAADWLKRLEATYEQMKRKEFVTALAVAEKVTEEVTLRTRQGVPPPPDQDEFMKFLMARLAWLVTTAPELLEDVGIRLLSLEGGIRGPVSKTHPAKAENLKEDLADAEQQLKKAVASLPAAPAAARNRGLNQIIALTEQLLAPIEAEVEKLIPAGGKPDGPTDWTKLGNKGDVPKPGRL